MIHSVWVARCNVGFYFTGIINITEWLKIVRHCRTCYETPQTYLLVHCDHYVLVTPRSRDKCNHHNAFQNYPQKSPTDCAYPDGEVDAFFFIDGQSNKRPNAEKKHVYYRYDKYKYKEGTVAVQRFCSTGLSGRHNNATLVRDLWLAKGPWPVTGIALFGRFSLPDDFTLILSSLPSKDPALVKMLEKL